MKWDKGNRGRRFRSELSGSKRLCEFSGMHFAFRDYSIAMARTVPGSECRTDGNVVMAVGG